MRQERTERPQPVPLPLELGSLRRQSSSGGTQGVRGCHFTSSKATPGLLLQLLFGEPVLPDLLRVPWDGTCTAWMP